MQHLQGRVVENRSLGGDLWLLRLQVPDLPPAQAGQFVHLECGADLTLPRPFSILDSHPESQDIDLLYRVVGEGTRRMTGWQPGWVTPLLGPVGRPFTPPPAGMEAVLVAGGVGVAPLDFLARTLVAQGVSVTLFLGMESEAPWPLRQASATETLEAGLALAHLQSRGIASRLASLTARPGWFTGYVTELAAAYLQRLPPDRRARCRLYTCGPLPMMAAVARLAERFGLQGEAALEARMACGFGGCAGCVVLIRAGEKGYYRRVCVDGPVFPLGDVDWQQQGH
ncbi:MAG: dihydroorotate dehydrogenase electron transfer subunit [Magnetococcales bacterium]|nr:dihydroorotate dehydrogenase electron transfer subunit [Magnetococcales bacterium]